MSWVILGVLIWLLLCVGVLWFLTCAADRRDRAERAALARRFDEMQRQWELENWRPDE